jgi:aquaporin Z
VPQAGSGIAIGRALVADLVVNKGALNPAVALAMRETISAGFWVPIVSSIAFAALFRTLKPANPA